MEMVKQQLVLAFKLVTFTGLYLFTRSRTPKHKRCSVNPEKSLLVLFLLENLKRIVLFNAFLKRNVENQVEALDKDIRMFRAFLKDARKVKVYRNDAVKDLVLQVEYVVSEAEDVMEAFNAEKHNREGNAFQRAIAGHMKLISIAKKLKVACVKVKHVYAQVRLC